MSTNKLAEHLNSVEWYDNHKIELILACPRKAFWHLVGPPQLGRDYHGPGLAITVGPGADFGTCTHAAYSAYKQTWGQANQLDREWIAYSAFEKQWLRLFPNGPDESKHSLVRGIQILQAYFERFRHEEALLRPVDYELAFTIRIEPRPSEPSFEPFWFCGRVDGVDERLSDANWFVNELKTSGSGAARRLKSLARSRQPKGYVWAMREVLKAQGTDPNKIAGFLGEVILVASKTTDFQRDYFPVRIEETESWRRQTINIVQEWRQRVALYRFSSDYPIKPARRFTDWQALFPENTEECNKYGMCPFWDLCQFGPSTSLLSDFSLDTWNPVGERQPTKQLIIANG